MSMESNTAARLRNMVIHLRWRLASVLTMAH